MGSIDQQIDAAVVLMKARAAEFNDTKTLHDEDGKLWPDCEPLALVERAITNLRRAYEELLLGERGVQSWPRRYLVDGLNDSALALSLLPDRNPGQGGAG